MLACAKTLLVTYGAESRYFLELSPSRSWKSHRALPQLLRSELFWTGLARNKIPFFMCVCECRCCYVCVEIFRALPPLSSVALYVPWPPMNLERRLGIFYLRCLCVLCLLCGVVLFRLFCSFKICLSYICLCLNSHTPSLATEIFQLVFVMFWVVAFSPSLHLCITKGRDSMKFLCDVGPEELFASVCDFIVGVLSCWNFSCSASSLTELCLCLYHPWT